MVGNENYDCDEFYSPRSGYSRHLSVFHVLLQWLHGNSLEERHAKYYRSSGKCSENHKYQEKSELNMLPWLSLFHKLSSIYTLISMTQAFFEVGHGLTTRDRGQTIQCVATNGRSQNTVPIASTQVAIKGIVQYSTRVHFLVEQSVARRGQEHTLSASRVARRSVATSCTYVSAINTTNFIQCNHCVQT